MDLASRLQALRNGTDLPEQSVIDSLKMNALKTITPLVVNCVYESELDEERFKFLLADQFKKSFLLQNQFEQKIISSIGELNETQKFFYRRTWSLAATSLNSTKSVEISQYSISLLLALLRTDLASKTALQKANFSDQHIDQFKSTLQQVISTSRFDSQDSYYSQLDSTLGNVATKIHHAINDLDFGSCRNEAYDLAKNGCLVFTEKLLQLFKDSAHERQGMMRLKSCLNHASTMFLAILNTAARQFPSRFTLDSFAVFEEQLSDQSAFIFDGLEYVVGSVSGVLLERQSRHLESVHFTKGSVCKTDFTLEQLIDALHKPFELVPGCTEENVAPVAFFNKFSKTINQAMTLSNFLEKNIHSQICPINDYEMKFVHRFVWSSVAESVAFLNKNKVHYSEQMLKAAINLSVYLNSEQPANNPTLAKVGLTEHQIDNYRAAKDVAFIGIDVNTLNYKKISVPLVTEIAKVFMHLNLFSWGISTGYIAGYVSQSVVNEALNIYNYRIKLARPGNKVEFFQQCLQEACSLYCKRWRSEAYLTMSGSHKSYARGQISLPEAQSIISRVSRNFTNDVSMVLTNYNKLRETFANCYPDELAQGQSHGFEFKLGGEDGLEKKFHSLPPMTK